MNREPRTYSDIVLILKEDRMIGGALARLESLGESLPSFVLAAAFALILAAAFIVERGGGVHTEAEQYIPHYLSQRPVLEKIFDFQKVEIIPVFRPRPLSYLVDDLDVSFIGWCTAKGYAHFESASYFVFWTLSSLLLWYIFRKLFGLDKLNAALVIGLLSTSPVIFLNSHYFRSAKPGAVFFMLCAFVALWGCFQSALGDKGGIGPPLRAVCGYVALTAACLFDEIPAAFCLAAIVMLTIDTYLSRDSRRRRAVRLCLVPTISALVTFIVYDVWIHQWLVARFTGETATLEFQKSFGASLLDHTLNAVLGTPYIFTEGIGYVAGSLPSALATALIAVLVVLWSQTSGRRAALRILAGAFLMAGVLFGMISQEHFILHFEPRRMLYLYPLSFVFGAFLGLSAARFLEARVTSRSVVHAGLLLLIASNITSLPTHWKILMQDGKRAAYSRAMVLALRSPGEITEQMLADPELQDSYPAVMKSEIYRCLLSVKRASK